MNDIERLQAELYKANRVAARLKRAFNIVFYADTDEDWERVYKHPDVIWADDFNYSDDDDSWFTGTD